MAAGLAERAARGLEANTYAWAARPHSYVRRIIQSVEVKGDLLATTTVYDLDCADAVRRVRVMAGDDAPGWLLVPLVILPRGELVDIFDVSMSGDDSVVVLTSAEGATVAERWLEVRLAQTMVELQRARFGPERRDRIEAALQPAVHAPRFATRALAVGNYDTAVHQLDGAVPDTRREEAQAICRPFLRWARFLAHHDYLWLRVPTGHERVTVRTSAVSHYQDNQQLAADASRWLGAKRWLAIMLGRRPSTLTFEVPQAFATDSFHLTMRVPDRMHAHDVFVERAEPPAREGRGSGPDDPTYERWEPGPESVLHSAPGSGVAHVQLRALRLHRDMKSADPRPGARVVVRLAEDLPGSVLPALVSAGFLAALSILLLVFLPSLLAGGGGTGDLPTAVPVLLFSVPAVAAVWFRAEDPGDLLRRPLLSTVSPLVVGGGSPLPSAWCTWSFKLADIHRTNAAVWSVWSVLTAGTVLWALALLWRAVRLVRAEFSTCHAWPAGRTRQRPPR